MENCSINWKNHMIICICKNVSEKVILKEIKEGCSFEDLQINLGVSVSCGSCKECIHTLIVKHKSKEEEVLLIK